MVKIALIPCAELKNDCLDRLYVDKCITHDNHLISFIEMVDFCHHVETFKNECRKHGIVLYHVISCNITYITVDNVVYANIVHDSSDNEYVMIEYLPLNLAESDSHVYITMLNCIRLAREEEKS